MAYQVGFQEEKMGSSMPSSTVKNIVRLTYHTYNTNLNVEGYLKKNISYALL